MSPALVASEASSASAARDSSRLKSVGRRLVLFRKMIFAMNFEDFYGIIRREEQRSRLALQLEEIPGLSSATPDGIGLSLQNFSKQPEPSRISRNVNGTLS